MTAAELRELAGVGAYTSAAIAAIAFGEKAPAVDTNVERVIARLEGLRQPSRPKVERLVLDFMPADRPGDFVQAMMDLGATICRPKKPRCGECPLARHCQAFASGEPEMFPERKARAARPNKYGVAYWIEHDGSVWLVRRPAKGLLGRMAALPGTDWSDAAAERVNALGTVRHVFTHFSLDLQIVPRAAPQGEGWWQRLDDLDKAGLPTLYRKAAELALTHDDRLAA
jgi:A/G-specific adenine glycosylase